MKGSIKKAGSTLFKAAKTAIKIKFNIATAKIQLIILGILLVVSLLTIFILGTIQVVTNISLYVTESEEQGAILNGGLVELSAEVLQYSDDLLRELKKENKAEYLDVLLALMMQESGGRGNDPMQASESKCGYIGCITDPQESIRYGVKHFLRVLEMAGGDIELTLQSYNFGSGFISFAKKRGTGYTYELAVEYSQIMYEKLKHLGIYQCHRPEAIALNACYGDILYVQAVMRYIGGQAVDGYATPLNVNKLRVTSKFGWRTLNKGLEHHNGVDYACVEGVDPVYVVQAGTVAIAGKHSGAPGYGNFVTVKHSPTFFTTYAHLDSVNVRNGEEVAAGQILGVCGNTGRSFGSHLHFETKSQLWRGYYDPQPFVNTIVQRIQGD